MTTITTTTAALQEIQIEVVVSFELEIEANWTSDLTDTSSDAFINLAELYIAPFEASLKALNEAEGSSTVEFVEIRVKRFSLSDDDNVAFSRRRSKDQLAKIKAEFETVYDTSAKLNVDEETNIDDIVVTINRDISKKITEQVQETVEKEINEGELNFLRLPEDFGVEAKSTVIESYSEYFVMHCDCDTGETQDYHECIGTEQVGFDSCQPSRMNHAPLL